jgi:hypothetical protein
MPEALNVVDSQIVANEWFISIEHLIGNQNISH